jgi:DNA polymerase-3 subunit gamma/tau
MLGLADRVRIVDLFESLMKGDVAAALTELRAQYDIGADPAVILSDLAEFTHFVTRVKVVPSVGEDVSLSEAERVRGRAFATQLSMRVLSRTWQMLLKGVGEVQASGRPVAAAEMVLVRIAYAADLPTPDEALRALGNGGAVTSGAAAPSRPASSAAPRAELPRSFAPSSSDGARMAANAPASMPVHAVASSAPQLRLSSLAEIVALAVEKRDLAMKTALESDIRLVRIEDGRLEIALEPHAQRTLANDISRRLEQWTGRRWAVAISNEPGQQTLRAQKQAQSDELKRGVTADPRVQAVLKRFPGASVEVRRVAPPETGDDFTPDMPNDDEQD